MALGLGVASADGQWEMDGSSLAACAMTMVIDLGYSGIFTIYFNIYIILALNYIIL